MLHSLVQIGGALAVLAAFTLAQLGVWRTDDRVYLAFNAGGALVLAVDAYLGAQWGFLLLEGVWAIVSFVGLARRGSPQRA